MVINNCSVTYTTYQNDQDKKKLQKLQFNEVCKMNNLTS